MLLLFVDVLGWFGLVWFDGVGALGCLGAGVDVMDEKKGEWKGADAIVISLLKYHADSKLGRFDRRIHSEYGET